jgi:hypothetical protein
VRNLQNRALQQRVRRQWEADPRKAPADNRPYFTSDPYEHDAVEAEFVASLRARELHQELQIQNAIEKEEELKALQNIYNGQMSPENVRMWYGVIREDLPKMQSLDKSMKAHANNPSWGKLNFIQSLGRGGGKASKRTRKLKKKEKKTRKH